MNILMIGHQYPKASDLYRSGFAHMRAKAYAKEHNIKVFVPNEKLSESYVHENIEVYEGNNKIVDTLLMAFKPDIIFVHFMNKDIYESIKYINKKLNRTIPVITWVHGYEALSWKRRLFNFTLSREFVYTAVANVKQLIFMRNMVNDEGISKFGYVFVSNWMKEVAEQDIGVKFKNFKIIPNPINEEIFNYTEKDSNLRKNILLIRPFNSKKYANDIAINAIEILSKESFFEDLTFTIIGKGKYFDKLTSKISKYKNVNLYNKFLTHSEIANEHKKNGLFLCPTRQDAQGVSMCEAMSSGLVPITSNNTAIPEFVKNYKTGILTNSSEEIAEAIKKLYYNEEKFKEISRNASQSIQKMCSNNEIISQELKYAEEMLKK